MSIKDTFDALVKECVDFNKADIIDGTTIAPVFHATTDKLGVCTHGLKARCELEGKCGLGGGTDKLISFTTNEELVKGIVHDLKNLIKIAKNDLNFTNYCSVLNEVDSKGVRDKTPCELFDDSLRYYYGANEKQTRDDETLERNRAMMEGMKKGLKVDIVFDYKTGDWERRELKLPKETVRQKFLNIWKLEYLKRRQKAGGLPDPIFWGFTPLDKLENLNESDVGVFEGEAVIPKHIIRKNMWGDEIITPINSLTELLDYLGSRDITSGSPYRLFDSLTEEENGWNYIQTEDELRLSRNMFHKLIERPDLAEESN